MTTKADVLRWILSETDKDDLAAVFSAYSDRYKTLTKMESTINAAYLHVDAPVTLQGLSPKYLNGLRGTVTRINRGSRGKVTCEVTLDHPLYQGRHYGTKTVNVPTSCVKMGSVS